MSLDQLAPQSPAWAKSDRQVPAKTPAWLELLTAELEASKAAADGNLDRALETAKRGGR